MTSQPTHPATLRAAVARRIAELKLTQQAVAGRAGLTQPQLSAWLAGKRGMRDDVLERLLAALDLVVAPMTPPTPNRKMSSVNGR